MDAVTSDQDLVARFRAGDVEALGLLFDRHHVRLYGYALSMTRDASQAEDLVQEAFVRLLEHDAARPLESVTAFLFVVVRHLATDERRRHAVRARERGTLARAMLDLQERRDAAPDRLHRAALEAIDALPDDQRETVLLKTYGELTFSEIGEVTGVTTATAASRYRYAIEKLAREMQEDRP